MAVGQAAPLVWRAMGDSMIHAEAVEKRFGDVRALANPIWAEWL